MLTADSIAMGKVTAPFDRFVQANRATVYRFLLAAVGPEAADDVFQDTFLAALRAWPKTFDDGRLDRWVLTIASRKAIDHHRRASKESVIAEVPETATTDPADTDPTLWRAVRELPPKQRVAVVYRHVLDRPYEEIAEALGCSIEAARANVSEGTRKLRRSIT